MPTPLPPFDLDLLRSFVAIADAGGFSRAAERIGRTQSTISLQIKRLEELLQQPLFLREGRRLSLTPAGDLMLDYARRVLDLHDEAIARTYPQVALAVNCDFTVNLLDGFAKGQYDLVLFKRALLPGQGEAGPEDGGTGVWRETLVWVAGPRLVLPPDGPLPLVLAPAPDVYRRGALAALDAAGRAWRIVLTSPSLAGLQAAVRAGLGLTVLPREMVPPDLVVRGGAEHRLPVLPATAIVLYRAPGARSPAADRLGDHIVQSLEAAAARG